VYLFLQDRMKHSDPSKDHIFRFLFSSYYGLAGAGLTVRFLDRYFQLLADATKHSKAHSLSAIVSTLRRCPTRRGYRTLQFSFATKLVATAVPTEPIYDSRVELVFGFQRPPNYLDFAERLQRYLKSYESIQEFYALALADFRVQQTIKTFIARLAPKSCLPEAKALDFMLWTAGGLLRKHEL